MHSTPHKGFTLIELLIVIAIIGLLSTLAVVSLGNSRRKARDTKRVSDIRQIRKALELGFNQGDGYPVEGTAISLGDATHTVLCGKGSTIGFMPKNTPANCDANKIYIGFIPPDPMSTGSYDYTGTVDSYCIEVVIESGVENLVAGTVIADNEAIRNGTCP